MDQPTQRRPWVPPSAGPQGAAQRQDKNMTSPSTNAVKGDKCHSVRGSNAADAGLKQELKKTQNTEVMGPHSCNATLLYMHSALTQFK